MISRLRSLVSGAPSVDDLESDESTRSDKHLEELERRLKEACTFASFAHEHPGVAHNERLEWLGDAVLHAEVSRRLFDAHPDWDEGRLSRARAAVLSNRSLARHLPPLGWAEAARVGNGHGALSEKERASLLEAVVGACSFTAPDWVAKVAATLVSDATLDSLDVKDPVTAVQERLQALRLPPPAYTYEKCDSHGWLCATRSELGGATAWGVTKKAARRATAEAVLALA